MKIKLDLNDAPLVRGFKDFDTANKQSVRNTLTTAAALSRKNAITNVKKNFTLRNTFTVRSIAYEKADQMEIKNMESKVGARERAFYLETQELGGVRKKRGNKTGPVALPMREVRAGRSMAQPVMKKKYITQVRRGQVKGRIKNKRLPKKARAVARLFMAKKLNKYIRRGSEYFSVIDIKKVGRNRIRVRLKHLYSINKEQIRVRPSPWLRPAIKKPARDLQNIYRTQLRRQWKTGPEKL